MDEMTANKSHATLINKSPTGSHEEINSNFGMVVHLHAYTIMLYEHLQCMQTGFQTSTNTFGKLRTSYAERYKQNVFDG